MSISPCNYGRRPKPHSLPSASWKTRKAGGVIQSDSKASEPETLIGKGRDDLPAQQER